MRPAQHFDLLDVEDREALQRHVLHHHVVHDDRDGLGSGEVEIGVAETTDVETRRDAPVRAFDVEAWDAARQLQDIAAAGEQLAHPFSRDRGHCDRHVLHVLVATLRGDDDGRHAGGVFLRERRRRNGDGDRCDSASAQQFRRGAKGFGAHSFPHGPELPARGRAKFKHGQKRLTPFHPIGARFRHKRGLLASGGALLASRGRRPCSDATAIPRRCRRLADPARRLRAAWRWLPATSCSAPACRRTSAPRRASASRRQRGRRRSPRRW